MQAKTPMDGGAHSGKSRSLAIALSFASVWIFWGSTYTAIRVGTTEMPALLFAGIRFTVAGLMLMIWCWARGLKLWWPPKTLFMLGAIGMLLLGGGNVGLIYAERTVPSGLASLMLAVIPIYVALIERFLPGGEPLSAQGWLGTVLGFAGLGVLIWHSIQEGLAQGCAHDLAYLVIMAGGLSWAVGSVLGRRKRPQVNSFVGAAWQMLLAGLVCTLLGSGQWGQVHLTHRGLWALAYLVTCGSLLGFSAYIYLLEHVPVTKVASYAYVNPVVAVILGIALLGERPRPEEFLGMVFVLAAVYLITSSRSGVAAAHKPQEEAEELPTG